MTAQRIEIELPLRDEKSRTRAMRKASETNGVMRVEVVRERNRLVVSGVGVDCVELTNSLRKKFCFARVVSVRNINSEQQCEATTMAEAGFAHCDFPQRTFYNYNYPTQYYHQPPYIAKPVQDLDPPMCSIM